MSRLHAAMIGFDITPRFHPEYGAWGTSPFVTELDMPLLSRCLVLQQDGRRVIWFGSDLCGEPVPFTDNLRDEVAEALGVERRQVIWSTSQAHSTGGLPGSIMSGSHINPLSQGDADFVEAERLRFMKSYVDAAREAIDRLQPARVSAGRGFCDSISYNSRLPMPDGGCKFSRDYGEALQGGKYFDPTVGLVRFDGDDGKPIGVIFNFNCHPAVLIVAKYCSPDYVGTARQFIETAADGAPAMFVQGFCGDVHPYHMFGTPQQAKRLGTRLGKAAAEGLGTLIPARAEPFDVGWKTVQLDCQPGPTREQCNEQIARREEFIDELKYNPQAEWCCGFNLPGPPHFTPRQRADTVQLTIDYYREALDQLEIGQTPRRTLDVTLGALRIGDVGCALSPGENFALTGLNVRRQSPFVHTLICGDTNGLFGYMGTDREIDRGGFETDFFWKILCFEGLRLAPAKGTAQRITDASVGLLAQLRRGNTQGTLA